MEVNKANYFDTSGHTNSNRVVVFCPVSITISFVGLAIIQMEGYILSSGQCNVVNSGEILWIGTRPGGNEKNLPMRIMGAATM